MINYKFIQTKWLIVGAREGSESFLLDDVAEAFSESSSILHSLDIQIP